MPLLDDVMSFLRVTDEVYRPEADMYVKAALSDMKRAGVREELLDPARPFPLVKTAVCFYAKASFGYDNPEADRFMATYRQILADLLNSSANEMAGEDDFGGVSAYVDLLED